MDYSNPNAQGQGSYLPSYAERRTQEYATQEANRLANAAASNDPYIRNMAEAAVRQAGGSMDARRDIYQSAQGQAARDAALSGRVIGALGQGNPLQYARNMSASVMGGFGANVFSGDGSISQFNGSVSGSGLVAEKATQFVMKQSMENLFGKNSADPSRNMGFTMDESAELFRNIARSSGGMNNLVSIRQNATFDDIVQSERQRSTNPVFQDRMKGLNAGNITDRIASAKSEGDDASVKFLSEIDSASKSGNATAIVGNEAAVKKVNDVQKEVQKSISLLTDVYSAIDPNALAQTMQQLSGLSTGGSGVSAMQAMVNSLSGFDPGSDIKLAKQQTSMIRRLTNAADANENVDMRFVTQNLMDPNIAFNNQQRTNAYTQLDERGSSTTKAFTQQTTSRMLDAAMGFGEGSKKSQSELAGMGISISAPDEASILADLTRMDTVMGKNYTGIDQLMGAMSTLSPEQKVQAEAILKEFEQATDQDGRASADRRARQMLGSLKGHGGSFDNYMKSGQATSDRDRLAKDSKAMDRRTNNVMRMASQSVSKAATESSLKASGLSPDMAGILLQDFGREGMTDIAAASQMADKDSALYKEMSLTMTPEAIAASREARLNTLAEESEVGRDVIDQMFDADGKFVGGSENLAGLVDSVGSSRTYGKVQRKRFEDERLQKLSMDVSPLKKDGKFSFMNLANSILTGETKGTDNPVLAAHMLDAMKEGGVNSLMAGGVDVMQEYGKFDIRDGVTQEAMDLVSKIDPNLDFEKEFGMTKEGMLKDKSAGTISKFMEYVGSSDKFVSAGNAGDFTVFSKPASEYVQEAGDISRKTAAYKLLNPNLKDGETTAELEAMGRGEGTINLDNFTKTDKGVKATGKDGEKKIVLKNQRDLFQRAEAINAADDNVLSGMVSLDSGGDIAKSFEEQIAVLRSAQKSGDAVEFRGSDGKDYKMFGAQIEKQIKIMEEAMSKLVGGGAGAPKEESVRTMRVELLEVVKDNRK